MEVHSLLGERALHVLLVLETGSDCVDARMPPGPSYLCDCAQRLHQITLGTLWRADLSTLILSVLADVIKARYSPTGFWRTLI